MVRAASNSISYVILLGISLVLIAYSLNVFLKFQGSIKEPMTVSISAVEKASEEFVSGMSHASLSGGVFLVKDSNSSMNFSGSFEIGLEDFGPYAAGRPVLVQMSILNLEAGLLLVDRISVRVLKGNESVYSKEFENLAVGYRIVKDIVFTPETEGKYTLHVEADGVKTEKNLSIESYLVEQGGFISGRKNFTLVNFSQEIFDYALKERRFGASGSGSLWSISIPDGFHYDTADFLEFEKNSSFPYISGQFIHSNDAYFNISEGETSLSFSEEFSIQICRDADFLDLLIGSSCPGGVNITLSYPQKVSNFELVYGEDICLVGSACPAPGIEIFGGSVGHLEFQTVSIELEGMLDKVTLAPECGVVLAGASLRNRSWHEYNSPGSVLLFVERTALQRINGEERDSRVDGVFNVYDIREPVEGGIKEFSIETDREISAPYIVYTELLNASEWAHSIPGKVLEQSVLLDISIPYGKKEFEKNVHFSSHEGRDDTRRNTWNFGSLFEGSPEFVLGTIGKNISSQYDTYYPHAVVHESINGKRHLSDPAGGDVRLWHTFVLEDVNESISVRFEYSNDYGDASFTGHVDILAFFGAVELHRIHQDISRGCPDCDICGGSGETLERSFNFTVPPGVIKSYVLVNSDLPERNCYGFSSYPSSRFQIELLDSSYSAGGYQETPCGWCCYGIHRAEASMHQMPRTLPLQDITGKARLVTDSVSHYNDNPLTGGEGDIIFVKKKPIRMDGLEFYENEEVPLNSSFSFRGTGRVSGTLKAMYISEEDIRVDIALFRSALLVLDPKETVEELEVHVNGRKVRNASSLSLPEKLDVSAELVPASENVLDLSAKNGLLEWKLILD